ncbi:type II secretion system F family protein [Rhizomicrobium electricum]|jgi:tight adherence protein B|uniref:Type II secretion system F family protein n=1 Tax=Rhizomicrobium electricum TaxID=480070 RepID=A0ABP3QAC8_9PROT|nr:type II secretion system F family protein [Rhizomicrobium electricum]NIJ49437.1 tight adherence protein B [Rhizomicrobium electricum]
MELMLAVMLVVLLGGGAVMVFAGGDDRSKARVAALGKPGERPGKPDANALRKKNMQAALKEFEKKQAEKKTTVTIRKRLDRAGLFATSPKSFWIASGALGLGTALLVLLKEQSLVIAALAGFAAGFGLPRWVLGFLKARREKKFTADFANAIDVIVRSVKSGLPTADALRIVANEFREPVSGEFKKLVEGMKVGLTLEQALRKMYDSMPTSEVNFFGIVMTIQQKTGGNLSEALGNLAGVLRDRKRLQGKIKAMSSEAKASAMIIGSLPPAVGGIVYLTTPAYISLLFTQKAGNLMLLACALWMGLGILVMRKMINFKH